MLHHFSLFPQEASTIAPQVDALYALLVGITVFFSALIFILIAVFAIKFRRRSELDRPADVHAPIALEVAWIAIPLMICMVLFFWGAHLYFVIERPPENAIDIHVIGKQWMWKIQQPNGRREINTLHVPTDIPVRLTLASQDVIHDFFIPAFRVKQDVIPGRYTTLWFQATDVGEYHLFCSQYCGNQHSGMVGTVIVQTPEEYQAWLAGVTPNESPVVNGARLYGSLGCGTCHGVQAPTLAGLYMTKVDLAGGGTVTADEDYLRESILDSGAKIVKGYPAIMPSFRGQITEEQLFDLIGYIKSLQNPANQINISPDRPLTPAINHAAPMEQDNFPVQHQEAPAKGW
ncbi:MAG TPA: cytochrome c oxidase subunit II [Tepidisphaeraceae bacterium]|jgi:cytochrome c oxidase subunit 2